MTTPTPAAAIYCDDCGKEKMAELRDGKLIIIDRRHGRRHVAALPLSVLKQLAEKDAKANAKEENANG